MLNKINYKSDRGFSLLELMVVLILVGVMAVIAAPNFLGLLNRIRVNGSFEQLVGAISEAQRQAIRQGASCRINFNVNTNIISATPNNCLLTNRQVNEAIYMRTNLSGSIPNILFSQKGNTTKMGTIVISSSGTNLQKCFVIALGTGMYRTGEYTGTKTGSVSSKKCSVS